MRALIWVLAAMMFAVPAAARNPLDALRDLKEQVKEPAKPAPKPSSSTASPAEKPRSDAAADLPSIPPFGEVPQQDEIKIGRYIAGSLLGASPLVDDPGLQQYVNRVGRWVASQSERPDLRWTFGVIESADINAFAAPGGYIFLTRGLYALMSDEAELAGVLAHEVSHVVRKHHLKVMQKSQLIGAGSDLLTKKLANKGKAVKTLIGSGAEIMARGLDKDAEFEADRDGVVLATRAGYDSFGLPLVLQQIGQVSSADSSVALLFKTHPHPDDRLARLGDAMGARFDAVTGSRNLPERMQKLQK